MLDWENFPGIRSADDPLPLVGILQFLRQHFDLRWLLAYSYRHALSRRSQAMLEELGFELRLLDQLLQQSGKKNALDLCLAMDAVRLAYTEGSEAYALLVAGDKDFAMVAAFIRRRLGLRVFAFGSSFCPNPSLECQVDRYFLLEQAALWVEQLCNEGGGSQPECLAKLELPLELIEAIRRLGTKLPASLGRLGALLREQSASKPFTGKLWQLLHRSGCRLSPDRQHVLAWSKALLDALHSHAPSPRRAKALQAVRIELVYALTKLGPQAHFPLRLALIREHMRSEHMSRVLSQRVKLWQLLVELGFELSEDHTSLLAAASDEARALLARVSCPTQLRLFEQTVSSQAPKKAAPVRVEPSAMALSATLIEHLDGARVLPLSRTKLLGLMDGAQRCLPFDE
jgi:hypothetical protein